VDTLIGITSLMMNVGDKMSGEYTTECTNENNEKRVTFATDNEKANMKGMKMST